MNFEDVLFRILMTVLVFVFVCFAVLVGIVAFLIARSLILGY